MIIRLMLLLVMGVVFSTVEGFGQIRTKEGLNINLYSTGSKKPLKIVGTNEEYYCITGGSLLDKIVISGKKESYNDTELEITIFKNNEDGEKEILLSKYFYGLFFNSKNKSYTLPIFPWIDDIGSYKVIIESGSSILLDMVYEVGYPDGEQG
jgi:hypothetical protein